MLGLGLDVTSRAVLSANWLARSADYADMVAAQKGLLLDLDGRLSGIPGRCWLNGRYYARFEDMPGATVTGGAGFLTGRYRDGSVSAPAAANTLLCTDLGAPVLDAATNMLSFSEVFDQGPDWSWQVNQPTITANAGVAPNGTTTAYRAQFPAADSRIIHSIVAPATNTTYTLSVHVRAVSGTATVRLAYYDGGGAGLTSSDFTVGTDWQRISAQFSSDATVGPGNVQIRTGAGSSAADVYLWGVQLEIGSRATEYIPTTTAAATRTALNAYIAGLSSLLEVPCAMEVEAYLPPIDGVTRDLITVAAGSSGLNQIRQSRGSSNVIVSTIVADNVAQNNDALAGPYTGEMVIKLASQQTPGNSQLFANGKAANESAITYPTGLDTLYLGTQRGVSSWGNLYLRRVVLRASRTDTEALAAASFTSLLDLGFAA